jgi:hypothetical protein
MATMASSLPYEATSEKGRPEDYHNGRDQPNKSNPKVLGQIERRHYDRHGWPNCVALIKPLQTVLFVDSNAAHPADDFPFRSGDRLHRQP